MYVPDLIGLLALLKAELIDVLMIDVVGSLLRNSSINLSSLNEFSISLSLSAELTRDTIVTMSIVLESIEFFPARVPDLFRDFPSSSFFDVPPPQKRLFALLDRLFNGADLTPRLDDI